MPIPPRPNLQHQLQHLASRKRADEEHQPRPARIRFFVPTSGIGMITMKGSKAITFGALMLEEPTFTWGVKALQVLKVDELPMCTAIVLKWLKGENGLYTGAEMGFRVDSLNTNVRLKWSLTFEASTLRSTVSGERSTQVVVASDGAQTTTFTK